MAWLYTLRFNSIREKRECPYTIWLTMKQTHEHRSSNKQATNIKIAGLQMTALTLEQLILRTPRLQPYSYRHNITIGCCSWILASI